MMSRQWAGRKLRIAQVAPLFVRVPPERYGGTERVVSALTEELVRRGHEVTLFAAGTSATAARLWSGSPLPLWDLDAHQRIAYEIAQVEDVVSSSGRFDLIHWHTEYLHWLVNEEMRTPSVTTLHGRLDGASLRQLFARHSSHPVISISNAQRRPLSGLELNWVATVYNGLDLARTYRLGSGDGGHLVFVGRSTPEKDLATAIRVAIRCGMPLKIAARIAPADLDYHRSHVVPLLGHPLVHWLGEASEEQKVALLEHAIALLMPINWEEPFGLSFIEALAAGTPVITRPMGALPEVMRHGEHGFFCDDEDDMVDACRRIDLIDRGACRSWALHRFSHVQMADGYESAYQRIVGAESSQVSVFPNTLSTNL